MKIFNLPRWFINISIAKKLYFAVGTMAVLIAIELFTLSFAINTLSSVRAFVSAEGLWSKAQKDAIYNLRKFARKGKEEDYQKFLHFLEIPLGDRKTRIEMTKANPNYDIMWKGFIEGGNHPDDVDGMIKLFLRFHSISYIHDAISVWTQGDLMMAEFQKTAFDLRILMALKDASPVK